MLKLEKSNANHVVPQILSHEKQELNQKQDRARQVVSVIPSFVLWRWSLRENSNFLFSTRSFEWKESGEK